jgi:ABC-type transport system substrate-binding protein
MEVSRKKIEELSGREDLIVGSYPMLGSFWLGFNLKLHVFKNKDLRQAILHAIDRTKIVEGKIISEDFIPSTILPYGILGYRKSNSKHDLEKAKYYLSKVPKDQLPTKNDMVVLIPKEIHPMGLYALQSIKKDLKKLNLPFAWKTLDVTYGKGKLADYYHHLRTKKDSSFILEEWLQQYQPQAI